MSTKIAPLTDEKKDQRKQIGCMTGIFHHFLTGRRVSSSSHKKLLLVAQDQVELQHATNTLIEREPKVQNAKPRKFSESSQPSYSSSCSSTFSSLDSIKTARPQKPPFQQTNTPQRQPPSQQTNTPQRQFHTNTTKEEQQSHDFRDLVKDSMYRESRGVSIKPINGERKGQTMKYIDSPRPLQHSKSEKSKTNSYERFALPRFSYDGKESRETFKSTMKLKEIPRLSLDSKASSMKNSGQETRSNFLRRDLRVENLESSRSLSTGQEPESRPRSSIIVAKLMGLDTLPDNISTSERTPTINSCTTTQKRENNANSVRKLSYPVKRAAFQTEQAPWRRKYSNREMSLQNKKAQQDLSPSSSTVYGEIEKRMTQLQFQKSGKDLRALKQILEAMQKKRERVDSETGNSAEFVQQKINSPKQLGSPIVVMKPVRVMDKVKGLSSMEVPVIMPKLQKIRILEQRKNSVRQQEPKEVTPRNTCYLKDQKKIFPGNCEVDRVIKASQLVTTENCSTSRKNVGTVSPRLQNKTHSAIPTSNSDRVKRGSSKKIQEKGSPGRIEKVKVKDRQPTEDQLSEYSSDTRYSSYQGDTASVKSDSNNSRNCENQNFMSISREDMASVKLAVTTAEQPSPVSVLNDAFYNEDSPSPVKKMSTVFRDETPSLDEREWHLENINHLLDCKRSEHGYVFNHQEYMKSLVCEQEFAKTKPGEKLVTRNDGTYNPDQSYIDMLLQSSGILKDTHNNFNQTSERKIVFELVNEILCRKISSNRSLTLARKTTSPQGILKDIHLEIDRLQKTPYYNDDDEDEGMIKLLTADMMYQTEDWTGHSSEVPAMALDIERLIFKDLINEIVMGEFTGPNSRPYSHCSRQLFSK